ncbi:hypothetical protein [Aquicoccus sp. SU-CL01552]|uniref:hypothetical protein n=1 Tax=Aquicoccus sp. SU-CL01552 TaxID=3127656 RepID=UPI0031026FD7
MSQVEELESRITAAMERIQAGLGALSDRAENTATAQQQADADLVAALEEERLVTAQFEERLKRTKAKHAEEIEALEAQIAEAGAVEEMRAEIETLTARLADTSAVDALSQEVEALKARLADTSETDALTREVERLKAELAARDPSDEVAAEMEMLRAQLDKQAEAAARLDMDLQRLRQSNEQLREVNATLREANQAAVGEPSLINKAMLAELEGLRATRATDAAEAGAILARLEPLLSNARNLPEGEDE